MISCTNQGNGPLGDVGRVIANPLQIRRDLQGGDDLPQVLGQGLAQGQHANGVVVDFVLVLVQLRVRLNDPAGEPGIAPHDAVDGGFKLPFGQPPHLRDRAFQKIQFLIERFDDVLGWHCLTLLLALPSAGRSLSRSDRLCNPVCARLGGW